MAPPKRTRSYRDSGTVSAAAVLAMCLTSGVTPAFSATAIASAKAVSWAAIDGCPGMSAQAKCDHRPVTRTEPRAWAASAAASTPGQSAGVAPPRLSPVSALRCSRARARTPTRTAAASTFATEAAEPAARSMSWRIASAGSPNVIMHRTGAVMPARRSATASSRSATPSQAAPPASAARAAGTMPWPYPSALTAASTWLPRTSSHSAATLAVIAPRSTKASLSIAVLSIAVTGSGTRPGAPGPGRRRRSGPGPGRRRHREIRPRLACPPGRAGTRPPGRPGQARGPGRAARR